MHIERHEWDIHAIRAGRRTRITSHVRALGAHSHHGPRPGRASKQNGTAFNSMNAASTPYRVVAALPWGDGPTVAAVAGASGGAAAASLTRYRCNAVRPPTSLTRGRCRNNAGRPAML